MHQRDGKHLTRQENTEAIKRVLKEIWQYIIRVFLYSKRQSLPMAYTARKGIRKATR